ncbi:hypothetical protein D5086_018543 [Populus alba]|uniref:Uncharacterized protein n=1 Tax=Populus alba TaxID=43335 RepID=A0ACC4BPY5_POPAL
MASLWSPGILLVLLLAFLLKTLPLVILAKSNQRSCKGINSIKLQAWIFRICCSVNRVPSQAYCRCYNVDFPGVDGVVRNRILRSQTARSWDFLHIKPRVVGGTLSKGHSGVGSIIGVMDTEVYGQSQKASEMRVCQRCHLVGEGHARKERDLIACIAIG